MKEEEQKIQELLKPRYEVINNYPDCDKHKIFVGGIITFDHKDYKSSQWYNDNGKSKVYDAYYDGYPHLFRKLRWYQKRELPQLPKYVFYPDSTSLHYGYHEVINWDKIDRGFLTIKSGDCPACGYIPATEAEYNEYLITLNR